MLAVGPILEDLVKHLCLNTFSDVNNAALLDEIVQRCRLGKQLFQFVTLMAQLEHIEAIEKRLWGAADTLRANSIPPVVSLIETGRVPTARARRWGESKKSGIRIL